MKTDSQPPLQISATAHSLAGHETRHGAGKAVNAPLKDSPGLSGNWNFGPGRKTTYHPSHFQVRHGVGLFKRVLNGLYREFLGSVAFTMTGKEQSNG
jgi:hypothetical protein